MFYFFFITLSFSFFFFFSSRRRHTRFSRDWSSDVCSSDLEVTMDPIERLIAHGADEGCVCMSHLEELVQELGLDDEQVEALYQQVEERGLELTDDCCREDAPSTTHVNGDLVTATTDALQLFLNEA